MQLNTEGNPSGSAIVLKPGPKRLDLKFPTSELTNFKSSSGAKNQGPPLLCYKDTVKANLKVCKPGGTTLRSWGKKAKNRVK